MNPESTGERSEEDSKLLQNSPGEYVDADEDAEESRAKVKKYKDPKFRVGDPINIDTPRGDDGPYRIGTPRAGDGTYTLVEADDESKPAKGGQAFHEDKLKRARN